MQQKTASAQDRHDLQLLEVTALDREKTNLKCFEIHKIETSTTPKMRTEDDWKTNQRLKYLAFVFYYKDNISTSKGKDLLAMFKIMSRFIGSRNPNQCRIYNKKMLQKWRTFDHLVDTIEKEAPNFTEIVQLYRQELTVDLFNRRPHKEEHKIHRIVQILPENRQDDPWIQASNKKADKIEQNDIVNDLDNSEKQKQDNLRTDVTIKQDAQEPQKRRTAISSSLFDGPSSFTVPDQSQTIMPSSSSFMPPMWSGFYSPGYNFSTLPAENSKISKQVQWQECHRLYEAWTSKLRQLLEKQQ